MGTPYHITQPAPTPTPYLYRLHPKAHARAARTYTFHRHHTTTNKHAQQQPQPLHPNLAVLVEDGEAVAGQEDGRQAGASPELVRIRSDVVGGPVHAAEGEELVAPAVAVVGHLLEQSSREREDNGARAVGGVGVYS